MIDKVLHRVNMRKACKHIIANKGSAGVDGMQVKELANYVLINRDRIALDIYNCKYLPQAILGVEIPKSNGKTRLLGIPTVIDRWLQQSVAQAIAPKFEIDFKRRKGVPQGSPLSPLLSNIMLHELDKHLEAQGLRYVRYADDFSIYTKSKQEAKKTGNKIYLFLKDKLKLGHIHFLGSSHTKRTVFLT